MSTTAEDLEMVIRDYWDPWGSRPTELAEALLASKWLAQHDREVAAKALRDAADRYDDYETFVASDGLRSIRMHGLSMDDWLRREAAHIESEAGSAAALDAWRAIAPALDALTEAKAIEIRDSRTAKLTTTEEEK